MWECVLHGAVDMHCFTFSETPYEPQPCVGVFYACNFLPATSYLRERHRLLPSLAIKQGTKYMPQIIYQKGACVPSDAPCRKPPTDAGNPDGCKFV